jgi:hypothetical protein
MLTAIVTALAIVAAPTHFIGYMQDDDGARVCDLHMRTDGTIVSKTPPPLSSVRKALTSLVVPSDLVTRWQRDGQVTSTYVPCVGEWGEAEEAVRGFMEAAGWVNVPDPAVAFDAVPRARVTYFQRARPAGGKSYTALISTKVAAETTIEFHERHDLDVNILLNMYKPPFDWREVLPGT